MKYKEIIPDSTLLEISIYKWKYKLMINLFHSIINEKKKDEKRRYPLSDVRQPVKI